MATYFHGSASEIQSSADGALQTLYLMNPTYVPYADAQQHHQTLLVNAPNALNLASLPHAPQVSPSPHPQQQHVIHGVATNILGSANSDHDHHPRPNLFGENLAAFHGFSGGGASAPRVHYNLWGAAAGEQPGTPSSSSGGGGGAFRRPSQQGLSLSLSSQQTAYRTVSGEIDVAGNHLAGIGNSPTSASNGVSGMQGVILGSKYLKSAQELLDEVVNVGRGIYKEEKFSEKVKANRESINSEASGGGGENSAGKQVVELSTAQRQELQMKKSKLVTMLDEVEQRYRQYHHQMQIVVSSFEQAAGYGAAKSYTALALKTISKQFRCLKDAISAQIKATSKTLGEDDCLGVKVEGSKLRYVDHHLRQQRALQQLGMIQPNAWRPQRGLPERAVSILRAWLFEHFLHPYPKDSDKVMLAKQTGLARSQVSNWFINARVRLWKPMVEEMYLEEIKEHDPANGSDNTRSKESSKELGSNVAPESGAIKLDHHLQSKKESFNNNQNTSPTNEISTNSSIMSPMGGSLQSHSGNFHLAGSAEMQRSPNKQIRNSEIQNSPSSILSVDMEMKHNSDHANNREGNTNAKFGIANHGGGFGAFPMDDIGSRFNVTTEQLASRFHGNGVSLTLGLPHNENLSMSGTQHGFLSQNIHLGRRLEMGTTNNGNEFCAINTTPPSSHSGNTTYESIDIQNRKRFVAQLLPDFVA